jgi:predicted SnoaL-like aldol condensation-catalyzing enzyme
MPLYEMIIQCRIGETQAVANLVKTLVISVYQEGGIVRQFKNLGDRIGQKNYKAKDGSYSNVIRYFAVEFDANPDTRSAAEKVARANSETLNVFTHKLNEKEYYKNILNKDAWKEVEVPNINRDEYKQESIKLAAKQAKELNLEDDLRKMINENIEKTKLI